MISFLLYRNWFAKFGGNFVRPQVAVSIYVTAASLSEFDVITITPVQPLLSLLHLLLEISWLPRIPPVPPSSLEEYRTTFWLVVFWHRPVTPHTIIISFFPSRGISILQSRDGMHESLIRNWPDLLLQVLVLRQVKVWAWPSISGPHFHTESWQVGGAWSVLRQREVFSSPDSEIIQPGLSRRNITTILSPLYLPICNSDLQWIPTLVTPHWWCGQTMLLHATYWLTYCELELGRKAEDTAHQATINTTHQHQHSSLHIHTQRALDLPKKYFY